MSSYIDLLRRVQNTVQPKRYIEIGVDKGASLSTVSLSTFAIGIDPDYKITEKLQGKIMLYKMTSNEFFRKKLIDNKYFQGSFDLAFIDGMHLIENVLQDFINLENFSSKQSTILIHDVIPANSKTSARIRKTKYWTGDVWKIVLILSEYRPDLKLILINAQPTGILLVGNLNKKKSSILKNEYPQILEKYCNLNYGHYRSKYNVFSDIIVEPNQIDDIYLKKLLNCSSISIYIDYIKILRSKLFKSIKTII